MVLFYGTIKIMKKSKFHKYRNRAEMLRKGGKTYGEINNILNVNIPKSTLSCWFTNVILSSEQIHKIELKKKIIGDKARALAVLSNKRKRKKYFNLIEKRVAYLHKVIKDKDVAKIALAMLYLREGSKRPHGYLVFGNSDPKIIVLFLKLIRYCYNINESKFRCTLQCRADQNIKRLEKFWSYETKIPHTQFYKAQIDPRTIGKPSQNIDYKGVCRIDYFSADLFYEIMKIAEVVQ